MQARTHAQIAGLARMQGRREGHEAFRDRPWPSSIGFGESVEGVAARMAGRRRRSAAGGGGGRWGERRAAAEAARVGGVWAGRDHGVEDFRDAVRPTLDTFLDGSAADVDGRRRAPPRAAKVLPPAGQLTTRDGAPRVGLQPSRSVGGAEAFRDGLATRDGSASVRDAPLPRGAAPGTCVGKGRESLGPRPRPFPGDFLETFLEREKRVGK